MAGTALHEDSAWAYVATLLPADLEARARALGALVRRRELGSAEALLRLALAYALTDLSLKDVAAWGHAAGVARLSGPGLFYRLRRAEAWLAELLARLLAAALPVPPARLPWLVADATVVNGPGAAGTDWRVHVQLDLTSGRLRGVAVSDGRGAESLHRHGLAAGAVVLADRGYARAREIAAVQAAGAALVVRFSPATLRLCDPARQRLAIAAAAAEVPRTGGVEWPVLVPIPPAPTRSRRPWPLARATAWLPARIIAARNRAGRVVWLLTTLAPARADTAAILHAYRLRWQVELLFKRLKSQLHLDALPAKPGATAKAWLLARLIAAALADRLQDATGALSPWGYALPPGRLDAEPLV
jgi:hypothetical protein